MWMEVIYVNIGTQGASLIYDLTRQIVKNANDKLSVRIQTDNPEKEDDALVEALYNVIVRGTHYLKYIKKDMSFCSYLFVLSIP